MSVKSCPWDGAATTVAQAGKNRPAAKVLGALVDSKLNLSQMCTFTAKVANSIRYCMKEHSQQITWKGLFPSRQNSLDHILSIESSLEPPPPSPSLQYKKVINKLEQFQQRASRTLRAETLALWGEAEEPELAQPGEETALGALNCTSPVH